MRKFVLTTDHAPFKIGDRVNQLMQYDYGLARDDTNYTGIEHISVTRDPNGGYPSHTVPMTALKEIHED